MSEELQSAIEKAKKIQTDKRQLIMGYLDIVLEHQNSIIVLIEHKLFGSALALVRPAFETFYKALWVSAKATDGQVARIYKDKDPFPHMNKIAKQIDEVYTGEKTFTKVSTENWKALNNFTHSGMLQVSRRFNIDKNTVEPTYDDVEKIAALDMTSSCLSLFAIQLFKGFSDDDRAEKVQSLFLDLYPADR
jgi:hypothetical protein